MKIFEYAILIGIGSTALILIMIVSYFTRRNVSASKDGFVIGGSEDRRKKSPHANCKHSSEIVLLFHKQQKINDIIFYEKHIGIMKEQMRYAEQRINDINFLCLKHFLKLLKDMHGSTNGISSSEQYVYYSRCLKELQNEEIILMRLCMRENHFSEKTEDEFNIYEESKTNSFINTGSEILNGLYAIKLKDWPTREQIYDHNQIIIDQIKAILKDILRTARRTAIEKNKYINELQEEIDTKFKEVFG